MSTYSQLKKIMCNPLSPPGVNGAPYVPKLYASSGKDISKCIESGSMKLTTQVNYICVCAVTNAFTCNYFYMYLIFFFFFYNIFL